MWSDEAESMCLFFTHDIDSGTLLGCSVQRRPTSCMRPQASDLPASVGVGLLVSYTRTPRPPPRHLPASSSELACLMDDAGDTLSSSILDCILGSCP
nr:unnamed protein product [Digitaria exilis]